MFLSSINYYFLLPRDQKSLPCIACLVFLPKANLASEVFFSFFIICLSFFPSCYLVNPCYFIRGCRPGDAILRVLCFLLIYENCPFCPLFLSLSLCMFFVFFFILSEVGRNLSIAVNHTSPDPLPFAHARTVLSLNFPPSSDCDFFAVVLVHDQKTRAGFYSFLLYTRILLDIRRRPSSHTAIS